MGFIQISLQNEQGKVERDVSTDPHVGDSFLPTVEANDICLSFIDPYGDTTFNQLQMKAFIPEWLRLAKSAQDGEEERFFQEVLVLARECEKGPHLYLKFHGD